MSTAHGTSEILDCTIMNFNPPWESRDVGFGYVEVVWKVVKKTYDKILR